MGSGRQHIDTAQRRARLGVRHRLASAGTGVGGPLAAADSVLALHATDPATVHLSAWARGGGPITSMERALYQDRQLIRMLGMRRTMFVLATALAPIVYAACCHSIAATQRAKLIKDLSSAEVGPDVAGWLADVERSALAALHARGQATAAELTADEPRLRTRLLMAPGKPYQAAPYVTNRVLLQLAVDGHIVRGEPVGGWTTNTYRWAPLDAWLPGGLPALDPATARAELVRRWLAVFGPAPLSDLKWWTGLGVRELAPALEAIGAVPVGLDGGETGLVLPTDVDPVPAPAPWAALLPGLDPTPMGWHRRDWYLGEQVAPAVVDRTGNIGPTVWWNGQIVGGWAQRRDGEIAYRLLVDVGTEAAAAVARAAAALGEWLGPARVTPRFPAPLDRELAGRER